MGIVVQNRYFARYGKRDEALRTRQRASQVRADAGRPVGRILVSVGQGHPVPDFVWECDYPNMDARDEDAAWADNSSEFEEVREVMSTLLERFERLVFEVLED